MKSLHYAFASVYHHKKSTFISLGIFLLFFCLMETFYLLQQSLNQLDSQLQSKFEASQIRENPLTQENFTHINHWYQQHLVTILLLFLIVMSIFLVSFFFSRRSELLHWRLTGTSSRKITCLFFLEFLILLLGVTILMTVLMILFQSIFSSLFTSLHTQILDRFDIQPTLIANTVSIQGKIITIVPLDQQLLTVTFTNVTWLVTVVKASLLTLVSLLVPFSILYLILMSLFLKYLPKYVR